MTKPWDPDDLWIKAKLFISLAMDENSLRDFDERAMWASLSLELLAKCSLARHSPVLIAAPTESGEHLLMATGLIEGEPHFNSIAAKTLFARCGRAFKPFSERDAMSIAMDRNGYLHGPDAQFTQLPESAWWPRFWSLAAILVHACDQDLSDFVGPNRKSTVEAYLETNKNLIKNRLEMLVARALQRRDRYVAGQMRSVEAKAWESQQDLTAGLRYRDDVPCPACREDGILEGDYVDSYEFQQERISEDDWDVWVEVVVNAEYFSCPQCKLVLDSYELVDAAGIDPCFVAIGDTASFEVEEYGND